MIKGVSAYYRRWFFAGVLFAAVPLFFHGVGVGLIQGRNDFTPSGYGVFSMPLLGLLAALAAFVPLRREFWLRCPGLLAFAVVTWLLVVGRLIEVIVFASRPSCDEIAFQLLYTLAAGALASFFASRVAGAIREERSRVLRMARVGCDGMWSFDIQTMAAEWDDAFGATFGYAKNEVGSDYEWWRSRVHPDDVDGVVKSVMEAVGNPEAVGWSGVYRFRRANGVYAWVMARCAFTQQPGSSMKIYGGLVEISDRIRIEEALRERVEERSRELASMTYAVTHDLKSPLSSILGYAELMRSSNLVTDAKSSSYLERIHGSASRMNAIIEDLLVHTRDEVDSPGFGPVRLSALFDDLQSEYSLELDRLEGTLTTPELDLPELHSSRSLLYRILQNLVGNALKYARPGVPPVVSIDARLTGRNLVFTVSDNGIGIENSDTPDIFDFGRRTAAATSTGVAGHGVGLHSVKQAVLRLGGEVRVESEPGRGSVFTVEIPARPLSAK